MYCEYCGITFGGSLNGHPGSLSLDSSLTWISVPSQLGRGARVASVSRGDLALPLVGQGDSGVELRARG